MLRSRMDGYLDGCDIFRGPACEYGRPNQMTMGFAQVLPGTHDLILNRAKTGLVLRLSQHIST